jgi:hypothetical protein
MLRIVTVRGRVRMTATAPAISVASISAPSALACDHGMAARQAHGSVRILYQSGPDGSRTLHNARPSRKVAQPGAALDCALLREGG